MRIWWLVALILLAIFGRIQGDTKILRQVEILSDDSVRQETFSLKNENSDEKELIIKGSHTQTIRSKKNPFLVHQIETIYVADKNGHRVFYKITREPMYERAPGPFPAPPPPAELNPNTLKGLGG